MLIRFSEVKELVPSSFNTDSVGYPGYPGSRGVITRFGERSGVHIVVGLFLFGLILFFSLIILLSYSL